MKLVSFVRKSDTAASSGFTLIESLVSIFMLAVSAVAVTGLAVAGIRSSFEAERQTIAMNLINEQAEIIRGMAYSDIGYTNAVGREPNGTLSREESFTRNQHPFTVTRAVELVDDSANGTLAAGALNEASADYKRVGVKGSWTTVAGNTREVSVVVTIAPEVNCTPQVLQAGTGGGGGAPGTGGGSCVPGTTDACPDPDLLSPTTPDGSVPGDGNPSTGNPPSGSCTIIVSGPGSGGGGGGGSGGGSGGSSTTTRGSCIPNTVTCPATGVCPGKPAQPACPPGASFCPQCYSDAQCGAGSSCVSGSCVSTPGSCTSNSQCGSGQVCAGGTCQSNCSSGGCSGGLVCNPSTGACESLCTSGSCSCDTGFSCNAATGVCEKPSPTPTPTPSGTPTTLPSGSPTAPTPGPFTLCSGPLLCPVGYACTSGTCQPTTGQPCSFAADCGAGMNCRLGGCEGSWCPTPGNACVAIADPLCPGSGTCTIPPNPTPYPVGGSGPGMTWGPGGSCNPTSTTLPNGSPVPPSCQQAWCDTDGDGRTNCGPDGSINAAPGQSCGAAGGGSGDTRTQCCYSLDQGGCNSPESSCQTSTGMVGHCVSSTNPSTGCATYSCVAEYCGNGVCDSSENTFICSADCGSPPSATPNITPPNTPSASPSNTPPVP